MSVIHPGGHLGKSHLCLLQPQSKDKAENHSNNNHKTILTPRASREQSLQKPKESRCLLHGLLWEEGRQHRGKQNHHPLTIILTIAIIAVWSCLKRTANASTCLPSRRHQREYKYWAVLTHLSSNSFCYYTLGTQGKTEVQRLIHPKLI